MLRKVMASKTNNSLRKMH